ncbi:hypothetical protein GCM10010910_06660 [Microbacterium nanhaiense]|uniref:DUF3040 domain-containing protein n=1 Tax=Microbacterium nanhaiense TaxID=1301026 RepID=A0ABQ2MZE6_9MICO|nr:DUF3040 domain-containing protein [Microbacterium nanhaiense]GGO60672.1 hypothetical protein GCM10010910_06660 [Microbacterium nanhaiense]
MPLSEQEQRLLDEMERHLMHNDADVVHAGAPRTLSYRNLLVGALLVLVGLGAVLAGISLWSATAVVAVIVGVVGFAAMVFGVILAFTPAKGSAPAEASTSTRAPRGSDSSFMDKMNDRWDRRQQG